MRNPTTGEVDCASGRINPHAMIDMRGRLGRRPADPLEAIRTAYDAVIADRVKLVSWHNIGLEHGIDGGENMKRAADAWACRLGIVPPWRAGRG